MIEGRLLETGSPGGPSPGEPSTGEPSTGEPPAESSQEPHIVFEDEALVLAWKPHRLHTAPRGSRAESATSANLAPSLCSWLFSFRPEIAPGVFDPEGLAVKSGRSSDEAGLFHRLDYETAGLVLFARSPQVLLSLLAAQERGSIGKTYVLRASRSGDGLPGSRPLLGSPRGFGGEAWKAALETDSLLLEALASAVIVSRFRPYGPGSARVACLEPGTKGRVARRGGTPDGVYSTEIRAATGSDGDLELRAVIRRGFRHQIRAHLAWLGLPLVGDPVYGGREAPFLALSATALDLEHPLTGTVLHLAID